MYPAELEIKDTTRSNTSASYLDLLLSIKSDGQLCTSLYDKRDDFNFHITNFPFLSSNIPSSPAYGVFISQHIRCARVCSSYECFIPMAARLPSKLLGQGYVMELLKSSFTKFYGRYGDLIKHYEVSLSQMLHDILGHDHIKCHRQLVRHYTNLRSYYRIWKSPLIVSRDSFSLWTWARVQTARSTAYFNNVTRYFWYTFILLYMFVYYIFMTSSLWLTVGPQST